MPASAARLLHHPLGAATLESVRHGHPGIRAGFGLERHDRRGLVALEFDLADLNIHGFQVKAGVLGQVLHQPLANGVLGFSRPIAADGPETGKEYGQKQRMEARQRHTRIIASDE